MISKEDRKILPTKSQQTASTASSDEDDDEDHRSFTDLICKRRRVRFCSHPNEFYYSIEGDGSDDDDDDVTASAAALDRTALWYSSMEIASHRRDVKQTIRVLRKHAHCWHSSTCRSSMRTRSNGGGGGGGDTGIKTSSSCENSQSSSSSFFPEHCHIDDEAMCFRGCERYYSLETRFMTQKLVVEAVLEAQKEPETNLELLRMLSEAFSQAGKDLAIWHATLNAFHCYGFSGLTQNKGGSTPSRTSNNEAYNDKTFERMRHSVSCPSPLASDEEDEEQQDQVKRPVKVLAAEATRRQQALCHHRRAHSLPAVLPRTPTTLLRRRQLTAATATAP